jgi:signal transduction histidine kinase
VALVRPELAPVARVQTSIPDDLEVWADGTDLIRILVHLLQNARRAVESGGGEREIRIDATHAGDHVRVAVADSGPGIPGELRHRLFRPETTPPARPLGTGLGLPTCRALARAGLGDLRVAPESPLGGACLHLLLPTHAPPRPEPTNG